MKFGKSIGNQQEGNLNLHYVEYKLLKKRIKDTVAQLEATELAEALTANRVFEEELAAEIAQVNSCFARHQTELLERTGELSEELQSWSNGAGEKQELHSWSSGAGETQDPDSAVGTASLGPRSELFRRLVEILREVDQLRKYAVWNAVAVVKILKKRRKQTNFGLEDSAGERAGWLARQSFFNGSDFAELHAAIESLGHMLVISQLPQLGGGEGGAATLRRQPQLRTPQQCPICLDTISDMVELSCNHRFCWKCYVLGPIANQPGEYRMEHCPICRRETSLLPHLPQEGPADVESFAACAAEVPGVTSAEGMLTRFLRTYFPQEDGLDAGEQLEAGGKGEQAEQEMRNVVGELVKALLTDGSWQRPPKDEIQQPQPQEPGVSGAASGSSAAPDDFFRTLPQKLPQDRNLLGAAQKLQWLQLASTGDPLALDDTMYCSLCSEPLLMEAVVTTPCKHHFHRVCIERVDLPQCPLCATALPFSWFVPSGHPCAEHGFPIVPARAYRPLFAGGPSRGTGAYPLHQPPPVSLHGPAGLTMKSYLHRIVPMGGGSGGGGEETPRHGDAGEPAFSEGAPAFQSPRRQQWEAGSSASESSSEDSNSEDGDGEGCGGHKREGRTHSWLYSALGRMRLCKMPDGAAASAGPAGTAGLASAAGAGGGSWGGPVEDGQRNPVVLFIGDHV